MERIALKIQQIHLSDLTRERIVTCIKLACMFLFLYTAYAKIVDHDRFLKGLKNVHIINGLAVYVSWFVPLSEILTFILLLVPRTLKWGFFAFTALMTIFTGYIISVLLLEKKLPCHCGGVIEKLSWTQHLWFNLAFIFLAIIAIRLFKSNQNFNNYKR
ncbi:MauE/DoxX family redox-associated membrane protein [Mucilaginibacter inviolabilis]|uniref:MauE/DoxX family redox-associated membrane protein n=1 Tax=Mucilaginibacter inviolabilis TaxID=2714892 RepID=UPI0034DAC1F0